MKKMILALALFCIGSQTFASKIMIQPDHTIRNEMIHWKFTNAEEGYFFVLGPDQKEYWVITNNQYTDGLPSDTLTVKCNAKETRVPAGNSITCYANFDDLNAFSIYPNDVKNGASGSFEYVEPNNQK